MRRKVISIRRGLLEERPITGALSNQLTRFFLRHQKNQKGACVPVCAWSTCLFEFDTVVSRFI